MKDHRPEAFQILRAIDGKRSFSVDKLFALMNQIQVTGSISGAAANLSVSYRYAWGLIQDAEKALGAELVIKQVGGAEGGGTTITEKGKRLLYQYDHLKQEIDDQLNGLLTSIEDKYVDSHDERPLRIGDHILLMASTIGPVEAGLVDALEQAYYRETGTLVRHIAAGSGRALDIARQGRVDLVLVHAPEQEQLFMEEGWGIERHYLMSNSFLLVGPKSDPARLCNIRSEAGVTGLFQQIALTQKPFVSRGDRSGTHLREMKVWKLAGIQPAEPWHMKTPTVMGNVGALQLAVEKEAYTLTDAATYWQMPCQDSMTVFSGETSDDVLLMNHYFLIIVNPERFAHVNVQDARRFAEWLTKGAGRALIAGFGNDNSPKSFF
ncbi:substrate-binding domain-containing protein [Anoxynatronum buryatiense]|uniref:Tungstate transport system substrate-binding protein n=1 Tax=Anoxynatronum buryatiense TaxID=489973 RepID=A0AA46AHK9_9CLOT|nr:substrate-binding domain-containing protein [Anoxynatronum buryatiense]SMP40119.1 tungstate transport system substrate-binding protein [Anoxynatronum buryatiense]